MTLHDSSTPENIPGFQLAIEVSTPQGSLAILETDQVLWSARWTRTSSHSEVITNHMNQGLKELNLKIQDLSFISVSRGPGSFTGLRVGITLAKTLAMSLQCPLVAPTSLESLAQSLKATDHGGEKLLVAINAFKGMVYWMTFESKNEFWERTTEPSASTWSEVELRLSPTAHYLFLGDGVLHLQNFISKNLLSRLRFPRGDESYPEAEDLGRWSWSLFRKGQTYSWDQLEPFYIRQSEAEEKFKSSR